MNLILIAFGGAIGAVCRYVLSNFFNRFYFGGVVLGTLFVNVIGCILIGLFMSMSKKYGLTNEIRLLFVTGFLGALTTFSTFSLESINLLQTNFTAFVLNVVLNVVLCLVATYFMLNIFK